MCVGEESLLWCGLEFCCGRIFGEISIPFCFKGRVGTCSLLFGVSVVGG